jgi:hypothetical protein
MFWSVTSVRVRYDGDGGTNSHNIGFLEWRGGSAKACAERCSLWPPLRRQSSRLCAILQVVVLSSSVPFGTAVVVEAIMIQNLSLLCFTCDLPLSRPPSAPPALATCPPRSSNDQVLPVDSGPTEPPVSARTSVCTLFLAYRLYRPLALLAVMIHEPQTMPATIVLLVLLTAVVLVMFPTCRLSLIRPEYRTGKAVRPRSG